MSTQVLSGQMTNRVRPSRKLVAQVKLAKPSE